MAAATSGRVDAVGRLLDHGAFVNARETANGQTALMFAAWEDRADAITLLIEHGAHVGITSLVMAMDEEFRARPEAPWLPLGLAALNRFLNAPLKRKHALRTARQAIAFVAGDAPAGR